MEKPITVYIEKAWVNGEFEGRGIQNPYMKASMRTLIADKRKAFVTRLEEEGFIVTYDKADIEEDTICIIMDDTAFCEKDIDIAEYKKLFDKRIAEGAKEPFYYPYTVSVEAFFEHSFFPAVFKIEFLNGGKDKFLIENEEQLEIIKSFYNQHHDIEPYKEGFANSVVQQFLETPGKYATYLRVLVGGNGEVMGASLKYSARADVRKELKGVFEPVFLDPNSEYYIHTDKMFNYYSGGGNIYFDQPSYSDEKREVLQSHGFDLDNLTLPADVLDVCKNLMNNCNRELGILCGIDFMLNKADEKWYYLENQAFPAIDEWLHAKNIRVPTHNVRGDLEMIRLELDARYEALMFAVNKQKKQENSMKLEMVLDTEK